MLKFGEVTNLPRLRERPLSKKNLKEFRAGSQIVISCLQFNYAIHEFPDP